MFFFDALRNRIFYRGDFLISELAIFACLIDGVYHCLSFRSLSIIKELFYILPVLFGSIQAFQRSGFINVDIAEPFFFYEVTNYNKNY